jgi:hypothetical protein
MEQLGTEIRWGTHGRFWPSPDAISILHQLKLYKDEPAEGRRT